MPRFEVIATADTVSRHIEPPSPKASVVFAKFSKVSVTDGGPFGKVLVPRLLSGDACAGAHSEFVCSSCVRGSALNMIVSCATAEGTVGGFVVTASVWMGNAVER